MWHAINVCAVTGRLRLQPAAIERFSCAESDPFNRKITGISEAALQVRSRPIAVQQSAIRCKTECAGTVASMVDPPRTPQTCRACGTIKPKTISDRDWGCVLQQDVASAQIVVLWARFGPELVCGR
jgi:hypothetical protein